MGNLSYKLKPQADQEALDVTTPTTNSLSYLCSRSSAGGVKYYPEFPTFSVGATWLDHFDREVLTPTSFPLLCSTSENGAATPFDSSNTTT